MNEYIKTPIDSDLLDEPSEDGERLVREFLQGLREESERRLDLLIKHLQENYQDKAGP